MVINTRTALAMAVLSLTVATARAQQPGHQMAGMASGSGGGAAMCAQSSAGVTRTIDLVYARLEDARQTNDASKLRTAIADLQSVFGQMKTQLADCVALASEGGGATGSMPGLDQSKMNMATGTPVVQPASPTPAPGAAGGAAMPGMDHSKMSMPAKPAAATAAAATTAAPAATVVFTVRTDPAPPRSGKNDFEVTLKDAGGKPIADAVVSLTFNMPAMPAMKTDAAHLTSAGNGVYKGSGTVGMSGDWDVTITASRQGQTLATKKVKLTAK